MALDSFGSILVLAVLAIVAALFCALLVVAIIILRRRPKQPAPQPLDLTVNVRSLDASGPSGDLPRLTYSGRPVRLAALVIAPVGRSGAIPDADRLLDAVDQLIPGLVEVISNDQPAVKFWPGQLSTHGFAHVFFRNVKLPGDRGVGTPWCSIAGKFKAGQQTYLAGMLCAAGEPDDLSEVAVENNEQWNQVLEVRRG